LLDLPRLESASAQDILEWALKTFGDRFAIVTSFQKEGMVTVDLARRLAEGVRVVTLDTGRLPEETHHMIEMVRQQYGIAVEVVLPDPEEVKRMVMANGPNLFYASVEARQMCCEVRKVRPLERKLAEVDAWAAGLRREQAETRSGVAKAEVVNGRVKLNPLADWTSAQVERYIQEHHVPVHPLYERGFQTVGCAPCTRAVAPGEDPRSGRWWWERDEHKECGIHFTPGGLVRHA